MDIRDELKRRRIFFDGGMGSMLQERGLLPGELPETWNLSHPEAVKEIHLEYLRAGADVVTANTFGANGFKYKKEEGYSLGSIVTAGVSLAKEAVKEAGHGYAALDLGPTGRLLAPCGDLDFEDACKAYKEVVEAGVRAGADLVVIETMGDSYELKAAVLAAKEVSSLPVFATVTLDEKGKMLTGGTVETAAALLEGLGADVIGLNCGLGPVQLLPFMKHLRSVSSLPLMVNPNAGLPRSENGRTVYDIDACGFAQAMKAMAECGVSVLGGCCGTTPEHIRRTLACMAQTRTARVQGAPAPEVRKKAAPDVSVFDRDWTKKRVAVELDPPTDADFAPLLEGARALQAAGADLLTIADSPLARTRANSILSAAIVKRETGMEVLPHLSCRDKNHIAIKGELLGACYEGIRQVLAVTGDPIMQEVFARRSAVFNFNSYELISFIEGLNRDVFQESPFAVGGALNVNAQSFASELKRAQKKEACGASFFLTQPIYTERALSNLALARHTLRGKIMAGFMPVASYKNALFLSHEVSGVEIPQEILQQLEGTTQQQAWDITVPYAAGLMKQAAPHCDGYYLMTPLRKTALVVRLMQEGMA